MLKGLIDWYLGALDSGGYPLIVLLMAVESSILPLPSELVIPPAAILAHNQGRFSLAGIVLAGTLGSWIGASVMYAVARWAGRPLLLKHGKYFLITPEKIHAAEIWCAHFGSIGVFVSRLLPVVRHLIGIPMGIAKMNFKLYSLFTLAGSALWCSVLAWLGQAVGQHPELLTGSLHRFAGLVLALAAVLGAVYYVFVQRVAIRR